MGARKLNPQLFLIKHMAKAKRMGQPLVIPVKTLVKVGLMPSKVGKMSEDDFAAAKKEALVKLRAAIGEDLTVHSMRQRKVGFRFFSGAAPHLYTDLGSAGWWHKDSRHYITTQAFDSIVIA